MEVTGLCLGASTIGMVQVEKKGDNIEIIKAETRAHDGDPRGTLLELLAGREKVCLAATGRKFRHLLRIPNISEPEAVEWAYRHCHRGEPLEGIVSAGGETFILYELDQQGQIGNVHSGSKCASGTGEFFLQQIQRMGLTPAQALEAGRGEEPYPVAGRCSVFCKSDCTHALNKGEKKGRVAAGLCQMMAWKILELTRKAGLNKVLLVGGTARNHLMVESLRPHLEVTLPQEAPYFEALGAALWGLVEGKAQEVAIGEESLFVSREGSFSFLPPLEKARERVTFETLAKAQARRGDRLLLGLDVGSTTTKAVLIREGDQALVASAYLRTSGDPVAASRRCYEILNQQVPAGVEVVGLGVTGSGRYIAGLHALTPGVSNEISAHATAALYFDPEVDTIFEIGGQDAKYTYLVNGVPADYAMNEACSAGTGSFLEEAAQESLEVEMTAIAPLAFEAHFPPNFNDQCAAFIGSDIKTAVQEGLTTPDILAGLVYSICMNYLTRVKGNRPVGGKVFMQGGVCYNQAVPVAMAALLDKEMVVPPEPGLMGAFGVALEVGEKLNRRLLPEGRFNLAQLAGREMEYGTPFTCPGDAGCDRRCTVNILKIEGKSYPFGGACSRYTTITSGKNPSGAPDLVHAREQLLFAGREGEQAPSGNRGRVGLTRSLMVNNLYPLYHQFFTSLGFEVIRAREPDLAGRSRQGAPFCYPVEQAHGYLADLLGQNPDYVFLPQLKGLPAARGEKVATTCPLVQGEPYYLATAFRELKDPGRLLAPILDFSRGYEAVEGEFVGLGVSLGANQAEAKEAYRQAVDYQERVQAEMRRQGEEFLAELAADPEKKAIVLFGRAYNAFTRDGNMGIPHKFASRGWRVIPCDFLPWQEEEGFSHMYWASGQMILQGARLVRRHPQLFGVYITNFSCGPDSFLLGYFRELMGDKPSLTLELDGHTADAGLDTRVEAFLDIVKGYLESARGMEAAASREGSRSQTMVTGKGVHIRRPTGEVLPLAHPRVQLLIPAMGDEGAGFLAAAFTRTGVRAKALPAPGERELRLGRNMSTCKECLPLQLTVGSLLRYLEENPPAQGEELVYFMPDTSGPCRFGQYQVFINQLLDRLGLTNVTTLSLSSENSYGGLGTGFTLRAWQAVVIADAMGDIKSALMALARDKEEARACFEGTCNRLTQALAQASWPRVAQTLEEVAADLARVELAGTLDQAPKVALLGEIYVRADSFSRQRLVERLAARGIVTKVAPVQEWLYYCDYLMQRGIARQSSLGGRIKNRLQLSVKVWMEREIKKRLAPSGLYQFHLTRVDKLIAAAEHLISPQLTGEAILTVAGALVEVIDQVDGAIAIGPFGCMPNRLAEAVAANTISKEKPRATDKEELVRRVLARYPHLPFMAIETDGSVFPQVVEARLESFILQVKRLHQAILEEGGRGN